jgi:cytochrome c6
MLMSDLAHADGAAIYKAKCQMCHGADGKGNAVMGVKPLDLTKSDTDLTKAIGEGVKPKMPAYGGKLSDAEIEEVVKYLKTLK